MCFHPGECYHLINLRMWSLCRIRRRLKVRDSVCSIRYRMCRSLKHPSRISSSIKDNPWFKTLADISAQLISIKIYSLYHQDGSHKNNNFYRWLILLRPEDSRETNISICKLRMSGACKSCWVRSNPKLSKINRSNNPVGRQQTKYLCSSSWINNRLKN